MHPAAPVKAKVEEGGGDSAGLRHLTKAATQLIKKPNIDEVPGATDEKCCESESCKKWPDVFQEAKAGCNQTSIHDDCPALKGQFSLQHMTVCVSPFFI